MRLVLTHNDIPYTFQDLEPDLGSPTHLALSEILGIAANKAQEPRAAMPQDRHCARQVVEHDDVDGPARKPPDRGWPGV